MIEFLVVVTCLLTVVSAASLVMNVILVKRVNGLEEEIKKASVLKRLKMLSRAVKTLRPLFAKHIRRLDKKVDKNHVAAEESKKEIIEGQFKLAELNNKSMQAQIEFFGKSSKEIIDSQFDVVQKNADDIIKLTTENSQRVYDALVILIQMTNRFMSMMGYTPSAPVPESGLEEPKRGQNYAQPPAQDESNQGGLTFTKR